MVFAYDTECSLRSAVALVNSAEDPDTLTTVEQLDAWYGENGFTGRHDSDAAELESVRALRPVLRELLTAERDHAAELVNQLLDGRERVRLLGGVHQGYGGEQRGLGVMGERHVDRLPHPRLVS